MKNPFETHEIKKKIENPFSTQESQISNPFNSTEVSDSNITFSSVVKKLRKSNDRTSNIYVNSLEKIGKSLNDKNSTEVKKILQQISNTNDYNRINEYIGELNEIAEKYKVEKRVQREKVESKTLKEQIDQIKSINLDFEYKYSSWEELSKKIYENVNYFSMTEEEKKEFNKVLDIQIRPQLESLLFISNNVDFNKLGESLDKILDKIYNAKIGSNGKVEVELEPGEIQTFKNLIGKGVNFVGDLGNMLEKTKGIIPHMKIKEGRVVFNSKKEAIYLIGNLKQGLAKLQGTLDKMINGIIDTVNYIFNSIILFGVKKFIEGLGFFEKKYLNFLEKDLEFSTTNGAGMFFVMLIANGIGILALNRSLESALSGVDYGVFEESKKSLKELQKVYKEAGLEKEAENIRKLYENIRTLHPEDGESKMLDNYKKLGQLYRELQSWKGTLPGDGIRYISSYIGDFLDNGTIFNTENLNVLKWITNPKMIVKLIKDVLLLPYKLGFIYLNKGPKGGIGGWQLRNKGLIVQDYIKEIKLNTDKFSKLFDIVDKFGEVLDLSNAEKQKLKKDIILEYKSNLPTSKLDPLKESKFERTGKIKFHKVNIDKIVADKLKNFIETKGVGYSNELSEQMIDLFSELKNNSEEFEKNREAIKLEKQKFENFIKYFPDISDKEEEQLLKQLDLQEVISISKDDFKRNIFELLGNGLDEEKLNKFLEDIKKGGGIIETKNTKVDQTKIFDILDKLKESGEISQEDYDLRKGNIKSFSLESKTLWLPHYVEIINTLIEGNSIDDIKYDNIDISLNNKEVYFSEKEKEVGIIEDNKEETSKSSNKEKKEKLTPKEKIEKINSLYKRAILQAELNGIEGIEDRFYDLDIEKTTLEQEQRFILNKLGLIKNSNLRKIGELRSEKKLIIEKLETEGLIVKKGEIYQIVDGKINDIIMKLNDLERPHFIKYIKKAFKTGG